MLSLVFTKHLDPLLAIAKENEGITVGLVVVPQAMAYASLARLSPAFGLYTTFTGACLYWIFGTSRDIVIGVSYSFHYVVIS